MYKNRHDWVGKGINLELCKWLSWSYKAMIHVQSRICSKENKNTSPVKFRLIGLVDRVFANGPGDLGSIPGRGILSNISYVSRVKWRHPGKRVAPSQCSSYWKGSLLVTLDYGRQLCQLLIDFKRMSTSLGLGNCVRCRFIFTSLCT